METIDTVEALEALYGTVSKPARAKVTKRLTPAYRRWIAASRYCVLSTVGPEGVDGSPRGDDGPVVREIGDDGRILAMPDWSGNQRIDSLRNIVRDGRASLMFMVPGAGLVVRVNARARVTADPDLVGGFERKGRRPRTVILFHIDEVYAQCPKAAIRSRLWTSGDESKGLPTLGEMLSDAASGCFNGKDFDRTYDPDKEEKLW